jgi:hypothetical protein
MGRSGNEFQSRSNGATSVRRIAQRHVMIPGPDRQGELELLDDVAIVENRGDRFEGPQSFLLRRGRPIGTAE